MDNKKRLTLIQDCLQTLEPTELHIDDDSADHVGHDNGGMGHFSIQICSRAFTNKTPVQCHQMIYAALGDLMKTDIHALRIHAKAP